MHEVLNVGIAGYGVVGKRRRHFIDQHPKLKTVAVCDQYFSENGTEHDGVRTYCHYKELLKNENLDILYVCITNDMAPEVTMAGLNNSLHVFCEKPPGKSVEDIINVRKVEQEHPALKLKYGFNHRYHDSVRDAQKMIQSEDFGKVLSMRGIYGKSIIVAFDSDWRTKRDIAGGGILLDQGIHMVDLMRLFGGEFYDVKSFISNSFLNYDIEDNAYALMRSENGVIAMLHSSATEWRHNFSLNITLERGALILSGILSGSKSYGSETLKFIFRGTEDQGNPREQLTTYIKDNSWKNEIDEFADIIFNDKKVETGSSKDALETMELVFRIYQSDPEWREKYNL